MNEDDKDEKSSEVKTAGLGAITPAKTMGAAKVFILTPEILANLGLTNQMMGRMASRDTAKNDDAMPQESQQNSNRRSHRSSDPIDGDAQRTTGGNKRKRKSTSVVNSNETSDASKSSSFEKLEEKVNGADENISAEVKESEESNSSTPKTKRQQKIKASNLLRDKLRDSKNENIGDTKDQSDKNNSGVRTSKRVIKLKKFDDCILTNDTVSLARTGSTGKKGRRRSSTNSCKNTDPIAQPPNETSKQVIVETNSKDESCSVEEKNLPTIEADDRKQENLQAKSPTTSEEPVFKVPESPSNVSKKDSIKPHEKPNQKLKHPTAETGPNVEKNSLKKTDAASSNPQVSGIKKSDEVENSLVAKNQLPHTVNNVGKKGRRRSSTNSPKNMDPITQPQSQTSKEIIVETNLKDELRLVEENTLPTIGADNGNQENLQAQNPAAFQKPLCEVSESSSNVGKKDSNEPREEPNQNEKLPTAETGANVEINSSQDAEATVPNAEVSESKKSFTAANHLLHDPNRPKFSKQKKTTKPDMIIKEENISPKKATPSKKNLQTSPIQTDPKISKLTIISSCETVPDIQFDPTTDLYEKNFSKFCEQSKRKLSTETTTTTTIESLETTNFSEGPSKDLKEKFFETASSVDFEKTSLTVRQLSTVGTAGLKDPEVESRAMEGVVVGAFTDESSETKKKTIKEFDQPIEIVKTELYEMEKLVERKNVTDPRAEFGTSSNRRISSESMRTISPDIIPMDTSQSPSPEQKKFPQTPQNLKSTEKFTTINIVEEIASTIKIEPTTIETENSRSKINLTFDEMDFDESIEASVIPTTISLSSTENFFVSTTKNSSFTCNKNDEATVSIPSTTRDSPGDEETVVSTMKITKNFIDENNYANNYAKISDRQIFSDEPEIIAYTRTTPPPLLTFRPDKFNDVNSNSTIVTEEIEKIQSNSTNENSSNRFDRTKTNIELSRRKNPNEESSSSFTIPNSEIRSTFSKTIEPENVTNRGSRKSVEIKAEILISELFIPESPEEKTKSTVAKPLANESSISQKNSSTNDDDRDYRTIETIVKKENVDVRPIDKTIERSPIVSNVKITRKKGRPRKIFNQKNSVESSPTIVKSETIAVVESNDNDDDDRIVERVTDCRTKRPTRRYADEIDGKGLSEASEESDVEIVAKPVKRPGRTSGVMTKGRTGGPRRGRSRGRGRGRAIDNEYVPRATTGSGKSNDEKNPEENKFKDSKKNKTNSEQIECAKCKKEMTKAEWARHNLMTHNGMGWLTGTEEPDYENDLKLFRSVLAVTMKKRSSLVCETCGTAKRSANGFISHLQFCGKNDEERQSLLVACPICNHMMMPLSMDVHERSHRQADKSMEEKKWDNALHPTFSRSKRKAAEKATTKILEFTDTIGDDGHGKNKCPEDEISNFVKKPRSTNQPSGVWKGIWKKELSTKGKAFCRQSSCRFVGNSMEEICDHSVVCTFAPRPMFVCKECNFSSETEKVVNDHVREKHWDGRPVSPVISDDDFDSEESSDNEEIDESSIKEKGEKKDNEKYRSLSMGVKFLDDEPSVDPRWNVCYPPALRWTMEFESKNYRLRLFEELSPRSMNLLEPKKSLEYLPELSQSMRIKLTEKSAKNEPVDWIRWQRFQGSINKGIQSMFTGGPVWAIAWLPLPAPVWDLTVDQYVALSTHPSTKSTYSIGKSYSEKNIIQIWNLGHLDHNKLTALKTPEFSYGVAHNYGTVWRLEWCPSGCYEHERFDDISTRPASTSEKRVKRMGLLAAACSDGCVHIFSLPFPEELKSTINDDDDDDSTDRRPIYETKPVLTLAISTPGYEKGEQKWQCTSLNWSKDLGHDTIIAGFSNGYIALWDPTTTSPLLVNSRGETTVIDAFHSFYAHDHAVSSVQMIPFGGKRFFYTTGYDRLTKLWDMEDLSYPIEISKRSIITAGSLFTNWAASVTACDDAYGMSNSHTYLMSVRQPGSKIIPLLAAKSTIYGVGTSDYGNCVAQGTLAGEVSVGFPHQLWIFRDKDKDGPKKRWVASTVQTVDLEPNEDSKTVETGTKRKINEQEYVYKPNTYKGCDDRYGIAFSDDLNRSKSGRRIHGKSTDPDEMLTVNIEQYPFASVNQVSWNPNAWSYLWLCVGYQNGIVRFLNFKIVSTERALRKLLSPHANSMLDRARKFKSNTAKDNYSSGLS